MCFKKKKYQPPSWGMAIGKCSEPKRLLGDWIEMALGGKQ
jgi:hypothetical protein